jgi:hypothetical protein
MGGWMGKEWREGWGFDWTTEEADLDATVVAS